MSIAVLHQAANLIRELGQRTPLDTGLRSKVSNFLRVNDFVEGVGIFEVDQCVHFDPTCSGKVLHPAKIIANYGTADGRVLYDVALSFNGGETYAVSVPLRDVVPAFLHSIPNTAVTEVEVKECSTLHVDVEDSSLASQIVTQ